MSTWSSSCTAPAAASRVIIAQYTYHKFTLLRIHLWKATFHVLTIPAFIQPGNWVDCTKANLTETSFPMRYKFVLCNGARLRGWTRWTIQPIHGHHVRVLCIFRAAIYDELRNGLS